jgi:cell division protein FtsI (penicillin-binding protein 3)
LKVTPGPDTSPVHRSRLLLAALTISLAFAALAWRLYTIQVLEHERYLASAKAMRRSTETILAYRGDIHSRDGVLLSRDVVDYDLGMDPRLISSEKLAQVVRLVSDAAGKPAEYRRQRLLVAREAREASAGYVHLANGVSESLVAEIRGALSRILSKQEEKALLVNPQARRSYPRGPLAGCLVGVTDSSASGIEGVELTLGPYLSRRDGRRVVLKDAPRKTLIYSMESPDVLPVGGYDVYLTIDSRIQAIVEEELEAGIRRERAEAGVFIAMDPNSGDLLAMASYPSYDPNHFSEYPDPERKARRANRAVENAYEPGSVIKVFFASQILEKKICRLDQHVRELITGPVSWDGGKSARFGRRTVSDVHEHPNMTFQDAVVHSSNIGMSILGLQLGRDGILDTLERFGLCQRTGVELPFEVRGKHTSAKDWNPIYSSVSVTFGYEVMVSPIQLCRAFAALVNGGYLLKPRIVDRISLDGETQVFPSRQVVGQAVTAETSAQMREVLKLVVEQGTGKLLRIEGFEFGGKTGTADMSRGGYTKTDYLASFEGFAPFEAPELVALCMIEKPRSGSYYGGLVAGPVVVEVFRRVFHVAGETRLAALAKKAVRN